MMNYLILFVGGLMAAALCLLEPVPTHQARADSAASVLVGKERFVATPRGGARVVARAFYTRASGVEMISRHSIQTRSDTTDVTYERRSSDNGKTWSEPSRIETNREAPGGILRRYLAPGFVDPTTGILLGMILQGTLPSDDPLEGMRRWSLRYALSKDGGCSYYHEAAIVHTGGEFSAEHPLPGVWIGKNSVMIGDTTCTPIRIRSGEILQPVQITPLGPDGEYYNPGGGYTYHDSAVLIGRWNDRQTLDWELSSLVKADPARSTRGMLEPTVAEFSDGRILMVMRGSNDAKPQLRGYRWYSVSSDQGRTWSEPKPWTYAGGVAFHSPSSCSQLIRHSGGRIFWVGNISPQNSRGNHPRYPLVIGEVDRESLLLKRETLSTIDDRGPDDPPNLQISNFYAHEDRQTGELLIYCSPLSRKHALSSGREEETKRQGLDWTSDAYLYRIRAAG